MSDRRQAPSTQTNQCLRSAQSVSFINLLLSSAFLSALMSCDMLQNNVQVTRAPSVATTLSKISPIAAKPNEVVSLTGRNFSETKSLKVSLALANGLRTSIPLTIKDSENASFVMPEGAGLGLKEASLTQGTSQLEVVKFNLIADQAVNQLPIWIGDASEICNTRDYIDRNGETKTGTKDCTALIPTPACTEDGGSNCLIDGSTYVAARKENLTAGNIKSGVTIAGVTGTVTQSPGNCASDGDVGCVVVGPSFAAATKSGAESKILSGQSVAGVSGNVTLPAVGKVLTSTQYGVSGTGSTGTLTLPSASNVLSGTGTYGDPGAQLTPSLANKGSWDLATSFPGAGYYSGTTNAPTDATIARGTTITGVAGSATLKPADCSTNAVTGCVTTATYQSADLTNLSAGNIKSGVTIAGTAGQYPSSSFQLTGSSGSDLTTATFNAQIKSSGTFQYFGSDGVRYTGAGDTDITAANIANGVDIFGATGSLTGAVAPDPWNVRVGVTVNGVTGKLKVNCRNRVNSGIYNYDGAVESIPQTTVNSGTAIDIWDTIEDYNGGDTGLPPSIVTAWGNNTDCGGVDTVASSADDDNVWKDVTTTTAGVASTCAADGARCTMQDKITGLSWSKLQSNQDWNTAWSNCQSLNHNGQTGWRLPTIKELMEGYTHSIRSAASNNWMTEADMNYYFWSGSSASDGADSAVFFYLARGYSDVAPMFVSPKVVCVR